MKQPRYFTPDDRRAMFEARDHIKDTLQPLTKHFAELYPPFSGFAYFSEDTYHDTAGSIVQISPASATTAHQQFQAANITNRRVDLQTTTVGGNFYEGRSDSKLVPSKMNPEQHSVAGFYVPAALGRRAAVFQLAFMREQLDGLSPDLVPIEKEFRNLLPNITPAMDELHNRAERYPNGSVADALFLDVPTTPNAMLFAWDTAQSTQLAQSNYPELRDFLSRAGEQVEDAALQIGGELLRPTGDGQLLAFEIPYPEYDRNSRHELSLYMYEIGLPATRALARVLKDITPAHKVHMGVSLGCVEQTTFDKSSPAVWDLSQADKKLGRGVTAIALTPTTEQIIKLTQPNFDPSVDILNNSSN